MSGRSRLLRKTLLWCSLPVVIVAALLVRHEMRSERPYVAGSETEGITRSLDRSVTAGGGGIRFSDVTAASGIAFVHFPFRRTSQLPEDMGPGSAWLDYDGDGDWDLFLPNFAAPLGASDEAVNESEAHDCLYRNEGNGTFTDVSAAAGVARAHRALGAAWGDVDGDGDADLLVTAWGENVLWANRGDGTFVDATAGAGLTGTGFWTGASFCDFDADGDLDLYVCNYVDYQPLSSEEVAKVASASDFPFTLNPSSHPPRANQLWINRGDGTFTEEASVRGVANESGRSLCALWADFDEDGRPDLYVANDVSDNALFWNAGDGRFVDKSYEALVADYRGAMGLAAGDWDEDLDLDLFVTHWIAQENALYTNVCQDGELLFVDDADHTGLGQIALDLIGWGTEFVDFDADGHLDLFVSNGSTFQEREDPSRLVAMEPHVYWNRGPEQGFFEVGEAAGARTTVPGVGRGASFCDYDQDGDVDVLLSRHGATPRLLRNDTVGGRSIAFRVRAGHDHRSGWGTRLLLTAGGKTMLRVVSPAPSYLSQSADEVVVGLAGAERVDRLEVTWPDGRTETHSDLAAGRRWLLEQDSKPRVEVEFPNKVTQSETLSTRAPETSRADDGAAGDSRWAIVANTETHLDADQTRRFWDLKREASGLLRHQRYAEALAPLDEMLGLDPRHEDALYERGNCLLELDRWQEAKASWEALLVVNPRATRALVQIGLLRSLPTAGDLFDLDEACRVLSEAHRLNPEQTGALVLWGEAATANGDLAEAERSLASAYRTNPQATSALMLGSYVAWKRGDRATADDLLRRAVASLDAEAPPNAVPGEGDTGQDLEAIRRRAAGRRIFAQCVAMLRAGDGASDADAIYACVDSARARLASAP